MSEGDSDCEAVQPCNIHLTQTGQEASTQTSIVTSSNTADVTTTATSKTHNSVDSEEDDDLPSKSQQSEEEEEDKEEEDWQGWDEEPESNEAVCLFCKNTAPTTVLWTHMKEHHGFDFYGIKAKRGLEFYDCIRLINFIRLQTKKGSSVADTIKAVNQSQWLTSEEYLKPVIEDDPLLFELDDNSESDEEDAPEQKRSGKPKKTPADPLMALEKTNAMLREQLQDAQSRIQQMQLAMKRFIEDADEKLLGPEKIVNPHDEGYFENYSARNIHEIMLKDKTRTLAYRDFILENKEMFEGKIVLDVGCGTGILCLFAAQAGAKQVIGVDAADIIDKAKIIVKTNKYDHIITFVKSKIEEAVLPVEKVDIIISEWMGYFLLFESMLPSVLFARDKWLVQGGLVLPNQATMFIAGARVAKKDSVEKFWKDVYGFDMRTLVDEKEVQVSCDVDDIAATKVCTTSQIIKHLDILTCRNPDLEFTTAFSLEAQQESLLDSLVVWFDVLFQHKSSKPIVLTTSPTSPSVPLTHWFQTVFYLHEHLSLQPGDMVVGSIQALRDKKCDRSYDVKLTYGIKGSEDVYIQEFTV
jgi:protein arginine N-methyltransferase 3